ncbi:unnamed protein product [Somion occarium]|uniref:Aminoglycoside phosphotransferase domain-containing protein n=1 Tax=Somion occarium TaxID=3059160 RepID=A0ABP1CNA8_9APHY
MATHSSRVRLTLFLCLRSDYDAKMRRSWKDHWFTRPPEVRSLYYQKLIRWSSFLAYHRSGCTQGLPFGLYAKWGDVRRRRSEALATMYVAATTTIPVPIVLDLVPHPRGSLIIMTRLPGKDIMDALDRGTVKPREFEDKIRDWLGQLHALPTPDRRAVCSFDGSPCICFRVQQDGDAFGPYPDISSFQQGLYTSIAYEHHPRLQEIGKKSYAKRHRISFAHGDIHLNNILVHHGKLSGLVDFECAGWYPEYWDFVVAYYMGQGVEKWKETLKKIFPQYSEELELEKEMWPVHMEFARWKTIRRYF